MADDTGSSRARLKATLERRTHRRAEVEGDVQLQAEQGFAFGWCADISAGGMRVKTSGAFPLGTQVAVRVQLEKHGEIDFIAEVVRSGDEELGLRFVSLKQQALEAILSCADPMKTTA